ncbi:hypothetical protein FNL55_03190 [Tardiphaga sp. vice352]|uniref:hypothetical protein n=1 Tax=unclassified Tardiphaga TaxID=2631404 RepID=UPI0011632769|nr:MULTISPECIES: hypothetical protein [unclassified Tardiphaga]QDM15062.1 hypothetical protein FNL53_03140 [Tardiphaga sp. vice278]QDM25251.1 hypothetical protein FNL56_03110 [Tardiphaga sp. vice304]QDM30459.1 hypothetical protein FNL55_03190 [Tardiphaga sp. vice352]
MRSPNSAERIREIADHVSALVSAEAFGNKVARIAQVAVDLYGGLGECRKYSAAIGEALEREPPPFDAEPYATLYQESATDPRWMATSLLTNSEREGDGSRRLWSLAACAPDKDEQRQLKRHAVDESKHSLMYLALLDLAFPNSVSVEFRNELRQLSPGFSMHMKLFPVKGSPYAKVPTIDDFLQMNIAEIRTTIHHVMQRRALEAHCPPRNRQAMKRIQDSLLNDELAHVGYTAFLIEKLSEGADQCNVAALFCKRFSDFNRITTEEFGDNAFDCSLACCARRDWCRAKKTEPNFYDG